MLADTHAHLYWPDYRKDLNEVLNRAKDNHVGLIINVGVDVEKSAEALRQVEGELGEFQDISFYSTIGIHPHEASKYRTDVSIHEDIDKLEQIYRSNSGKVVGVGECGLDYFFRSNDLSPTDLSYNHQKELQKKLLLAQKELAKKLNLPLVVHIRDDRTQNPTNSECWSEALDLIGDHFGILHCYSGTEEITRRALNLNFLFSFAANITYPKNEYLREAAKTIPLEKIVLETDCPFLSPQSRRGARNEPSATMESAQLIASLKGATLEELEEQTTLNAKTAFRID